MYSFIPFIIILIGFGAFFLKKLPETKNKSYSEIYDEMGLTELAKEAHKEEEMFDEDNLGSVTFVSHSHTLSLYIYPSISHTHTFIPWK